MRIALLAGLLASVFGLVADEPPTPQPRLLLTSKLLRRLKRDRERQTIRWVHFENRIKNVPDSPERGFELALYFAVTADDSRAKEAITWAAAHPCERRQRALIQDWVGAVAPANCTTPASLRDQAFEGVAAGADTADLAQTVQTRIVPQLVEHGVQDPAELYSTLELLSILRSTSGGDIRSGAAPFFRALPIEFLLSLKPTQVEKPDWLTHVAGLALVALDPNLEASQFLQGWVMEEHQTLREGPGVAYELLWADPYLPGIAYQNLDPWIYDEAGARVFARSDWSPAACWINISKAGPAAVNCPAGWQDQTTHFGFMTLMPMPTKCLELPHQDSRQNLVIWKFEPGQSVVYRDKKEISAHADSSGIWHPGSNVDGKVCRR